MSDEAGVATEAPPVESPTIESAEPQQQQELQAPELEKPTNKQSARRNAVKVAKHRAQMAEIAEAKRQQALGQPRKDAGTPEGGQFKKGEGGQESPPEPEDVAEAPSEAETPAAEQASGADSEIDAGSQAEKEAPDSEFVVIQLPDDHPLRDRGKTHLRVHKDDEAEARNGINAAVRERKLRQRYEELEREKALLEARQQVLSSDEYVQYETKPEYQALLQQMREAPGFGDEMAETVLAGLKALEAQKLMDAERQAEGKLGIVRTTEQFVGAVEANAPEVLTVWAESGELQARMPTLIQQYLQAVDRRNEREGKVTPPSPPEFFHYVGKAYRADPRVSAKIEQVRETDAQRARERIRQEVRAELEAERRQQAEEAKQRHSSRPPTARTIQPTSTQRAQAEDGGEGHEPKSVHSYRKQARRAARDIGRGFAR